ncbi:MAG: tetratricopeptide repeat protein [Candidatus Thorarchaeota archaeon]
MYVEGKGKFKALIKVEKLVDEYEYTKAMQVLKNIKTTEKLSPYIKVLSLCLQCRILLWQGKDQECFETADQGYKDSLELGLKKLSFNSLLLMAEASSNLYKYDKSRDLINQAKQLFDSYQNVKSKEYIFNKAYLALLEGISISLIDLNQALECFKNSLLSWDKIDSKLEKVKSLYWIGMLYGSRGELDKGIKYLKQSLAIAKEINYNRGIAEALMTLGAEYWAKGDLNLSLLYSKQSLEFFEKMRKKEMIAAVLNNIALIYSEMGEYDRALEYLEKSIAIEQKSYNLGSGVEICLENGDLERAKQYFQNYEEISKSFRYRSSEFYYYLLKASILKHSTKISNKIKAEEILKKIIQLTDFKMDIFGFEGVVKTLIHICDFQVDKLLSEIDLKVMDELNSYITKLMNIAEKSNTPLFLGEIHLFQAKLFLMIFDLENAQKSILEAQKIAERLNLSNLSHRVSKEHERFVQHSRKIQKIKDSNKNIINLSQLNPMKEQIKYMLRKRSILKKFNI